MVISAVVPGSGHLLLGLRRKGYVLLVCFLLLLTCFWPFRLLQFYAGFIVLYGGWIALFLYATCNAQMTWEPSAGRRPSRWWLAATIPVAIISLSLLGRGITKASGFRSFIVPSTSMEGTIQRGDHVLADMWYYHSHPIGRPDVIVFSRDETFYAKRIIAIPGDTIEGRDDLIYVNGHLIEEDYVVHRKSSDPRGYEYMSTFGPTSVPLGKVFVMGDNRDVSLDSRLPVFGLVDQSSIAGKVLYVFGSDRLGTRIR